MSGTTSTTETTITPTAASYLTRPGDVVDAICFTYYGTLDGRIFEQVLAANFGLADYGPVLPGGLTITLPVVTSSGATVGTKLWS